MEEYRNLIELLSSKGNSSLLEKKEIEKIFEFNDALIKDVVCTIARFHNLFIFIELSYFVNNCRKSKSISLVIKPYEFTKDKKNYICFEK